MLVLGSVELRKMLPVTQTSLWFGLLKNLKINYQQSDVLQNVILRCYKQYTIYKYIQNVSCRIRGSGPYTRIWTLEFLQLSVTIFCIPNPWLQDKHRQTHGHHKKNRRNWPSLAQNIPPTAWQQWMINCIYRKEKPITLKSTPKWWGGSKSSRHIKTIKL